MARSFLRSNKSCASPGAFICFDTETLPEPYPSHDGAELHKLRLGVAVYFRLEKGKQTRREVFRFTKSSQFWSWVANKLHPRIPIWVWAHNLPFDLTVVEFWKLLEAGLFQLTDPEQEAGGNQHDGKGRGWGKGFMLLDDPPTVISCKMSGVGRLILCDTLNYFLTSLKKMGEAVGHAKLDMPAFDAPDSEWWPYCENDVVVTEKCVVGLVNWVKENDLGRFRYTRAAQALSAFRHRFKMQPIEFHDEPDVRNLERACYFGGRLEAYFLGECVSSPPTKQQKRMFRSDPAGLTPRAPIYELDVCSLYPHVMRENCFPNRLLDSSFERGSVGDWRRELGGDCCAVVRLVTDNEYPVRHPSIGTYYPRGDYYTALCGAELDRALTAGDVVECAAWSRYNLSPLFGPFVDYFWTRRAEYEKSGDTLYAELCKYIMNSLYGKFGQLSAEWVDRQGLEPPTNWGPWIVDNRAAGTETEYRVVGGNVQERIPRGELFNTSPAIAAWVTAYGREAIRNIREAAGRENCLYLVTDAVYVTQEGYDRLAAAGWIADRVMGKLSVKHVADSCEIRGLHHLTLGEHVKHGAIKATAVKIGKNRYREIRFQHLASILAGRQDESRTGADTAGDAGVGAGRLPPLPGVLVYPVEKEIRLSYTRGVQTASGWVSPLTINDGRSNEQVRKQLGLSQPFSGYGPEPDCPVGTGSRSARR